MYERVHQCLDGELPRSALSPAEEAELAALNDAVQAARAHVAAPRFPDLTARVMQALPAAPVAAPAVHAPSLGERLRAALAWTWTPRSFVLRPAYGFAGALAMALLLALAPRVERGLGGPAAQPAQVVYVQFRLDAPGATRVELAGSFSNWQPRHQLREVAPGVWNVTVPLGPGVYDYQFVVDGKQWVPDPAARPVDDGFGGTNSRLYLTPGRAQT
jgi:hypothetical protein